MTDIEQIHYIDRLDKYLDLMLSKNTNIANPRYFLEIKDGGKITTKASEFNFKKQSLNIFNFMVDIPQYRDSNNTSRSCDPMFTLSMPYNHGILLHDAIDKNDVKTYFRLYITDGSGSKDGGKVDEETYMDFYTLKTYKIRHYNDLMGICAIFGRGLLKSKFDKNDINLVSSGTFSLKFGNTLNVK
jgi:hypothetical protein